MFFPTGTMDSLESGNPLYRSGIDGIVKLRWYKSEFR